MSTSTNMFYDSNIITKCIHVQGEMHFIIQLCIFDISECISTYPNIPTNETDLPLCINDHHINIYYVAILIVCCEKSTTTINNVTTLNKRIKIFTGIE